MCVCVHMHAHLCQRARTDLYMRVQVHASACARGHAPPTDGTCTGELANERQLPQRLCGTQRQTGGGQWVLDCISTGASLIGPIVAVVVAIENIRFWNTISIVALKLA